MEINRTWQMPNKNTFDIKPINDLIQKYIVKLPDNPVIIDPFANKNKIATITNDLNNSFDTDYHLEATDFLKLMPSEGVDMVLYDPPFSPRQLSECYKAFGLSVNMETTQASYWSKQKAEIGRVVKTGGYVITCGWNSGGIGKKYGFEIVEILLVAHGGWHNDTIITVDRKM